MTNHEDETPLLFGVTIVLPRTNRGLHQSCPSLLERASRFLSLLLLIAACIFHGPVGAAQDVKEEKDGRSETALAVCKRVEQIHVLRMERLRIRERQQSEIARLERDIERLNLDLDRVESSLQESRRSVDDLQSEIGKAAGSNRELERVLSRAAERLVPALQRMKERIAAGIPFRKRERLDQVEQCLEGIENDDITTRADSLHDALWNFAEELNHARSIGLWNEPVQLEGGIRQLHVYQVRIGLVIQFFVSEDGRTIGHFPGTTGSSWNLAVDEEDREELRIALDVLRRRVPPRIVAVPCEVDRDRGSAGENPHEDEDTGDEGEKDE